MTAQATIDINNAQLLQPSFAKELSMVTAKVVAVEGSLFQLEGDLIAEQAFSCLVVPDLGDIVLVCRTDRINNTKSAIADEIKTRNPQVAQIISILSRESKTPQTIRTLGVEALTLQAPSIRFIATNRVQTLAGKAIELVSGAGTITQQARNVTVNAVSNLISVSKRYITKSEHWSVDAKDILTIKGGHSLIEAENEMRLNAKHINMG